LAVERYDLIVQAGIAGSFSGILPKLSVVRVVSEECADQGAEGKDGFLHLTDMGLLDSEQFPFRSGKLCAPDVNIEALASMPLAHSVTVNRVLSEARSISWIRERFDPDIVNMEGAGFFYAALFAGVPFLALRSISDMVGPRNKDTWDIPGAVRALDGALEAVIDECKAQV
jgi:futalosine hydrolase